jgi:transcriptional regulator with XRE-family HTH domain
VDTSALPDGTELASAIRAYRHSKGVTQTEFARRLGVTQQTVARWERGFPPREDLLIRIRAVIGEGLEDIELAEVVPLHAPKEEDLRGPLEDDGRAKLRDRFLAASIRKFERGDRLTESVLNFIVEELGPKTEG